MSRNSETIEGMVRHKEYEPLISVDPNLSYTEETIVDRLVRYLPCRLDERERERLVAVLKITIPNLYYLRKRKLSDEEVSFDGSTWIGTPHNLNNVTLSALLGYRVVIKGFDSRYLYYRRVGKRISEKMTLAALSLLLEEQIVTFFGHDRFTLSYDAFSSRWKSTVSTDWEEEVYTFNVTDRSRLAVLIRMVRELRRDPLATTTGESAQPKQERK